MMARLILLIMFGTMSAVLVRAQQSAGTADAIEKRRVKYDERLGRTYDKTFRAVSTISVEKPIGEFEAYALSSAYFYSHISACGGVKMPTDKGDRWVAETLEGYGGVPGPQIIVEKKAGITYSPGRPKVKDPKEYLKFIRNI